MYKSISEIFKKGARFLVTTHIGPDGDAVGSVFAISGLLENMGKDVVIVCQDDIPENLSFMKRTWTRADEWNNSGEFDGVIVLDSPSWKRIGMVANHITGEPCIINIDHHISNNGFGTVQIVDPQASSCAEIVFNLFTACAQPITQEIAAWLYIGISTDTGSFRYQNVTAKTYAAVSELLGTGLDIPALNEALYSHMPFRKVQLFGMLMARIERSYDGHIAWVKIKDTDLKGINASTADLEGFVDVIRNIEDVYVAFSAYISDVSGEVKISLRAKGSCDVNNIARTFGGGGHAKAAGCSVPGDIDEAVKRMCACAAEELNICTRKG